MSRLPNLTYRHKICVICEGYEELAYFNRLITLNVWSNSYEFYPVNAKSASNISARFQDAFNNDRYEAVLIFCDTDKAPYREYSQIKTKINRFLSKRLVAEKLIIFANPCTMQIVLSHFGEVSLKNQGKKTNAGIIEQYTGVSDYDAHEDQIKEICKKIYKRTYKDMRDRVEKINLPDNVSGSTNFFSFLVQFEQDNTDWIKEIRKRTKE